MHLVIVQVVSMLSTVYLPKLDGQPETKWYSKLYKNIFKTNVYTATLKGFACCAFVLQRIPLCCMMGMESTTI